MPAHDVHVPLNWPCKLKRYLSTCLLWHADPVPISACKMLKPNWKNASANFSFIFFFWQLNFFPFNFFFAVSGAPYPFLSLSFLIRMLCHSEIFCNLFHTAKYIAHVHPPMDGGLSWAELSRAEMSWVCYGVKQRHCDYFMNTEMISALSNVQSWDCVRRCCFCYYIFCKILCSISFPLLVFLP